MSKGVVTIALQAFVAADGCRISSCLPWLLATPPVLRIFHTLVMSPKFEKGVAGNIGGLMRVAASLLLNAVHPWWRNNPEAWPVEGAKGTGHGWPCFGKDGGPGGAYHLSNVCGTAHGL